MSERIALLIESDGPGGAESVVMSLATEYRSAGHHVFPVVHRNGPGWLSGRLISAGFSVYQPALRRPLDPSAFRALSSWMRTHTITAVHTHEFTTSVYGSVAAKMQGLRCVMTMHGGKSYTLALRRRVALALAARCAHHVVGVSGDTATVLEESLWLPRGSVTVVPNGVPARAGHRKRARAALGLAAGERLILAVGNLYPVKGHAVLVRAAGLLARRSDLPTWRVAIAGRGDQEQPLRQLIAEEQVADRVSLLGLRDDIPDLLAAADLFVMPSLSEGLPMAILEAMYAGVPVVCSSVGGVPDVLEHGSLGLLFPAGDASSLAQALEESLVQEAIGRDRAMRAQQRVETRYSAKAMADAYLSLLTRS